MSLKFSPAAERNREPILEQLRVKLPGEGKVLEIASGSGQHVSYFATALPSLSWQPSDLDASSFDSIRGYVAQAAVSNVLEPVELDVTSTPWPLQQVDAIYCANMLHISPWQVTHGLFRGAAPTLPPGAMLHVYGPFKIAGEHIAPTNAAFDLSLRDRNADWGVRDLEAVASVAAECGFSTPAVTAMPANNLFLSFERTSLA